MDIPVTLVTGARKGIGRALAERYLAQGHTVVGCSRAASDLDHPRYVHHLTDVADEAGVATMFARIRKERDGSTTC